jgi:hypothetical protein
MFLDEIDRHLESIAHNNSNEIIMGVGVNADIGHRNTNKITD